jgi:hypothetical protein
MTLSVDDCLGSSIANLAVYPSALWLSGCKSLCDGSASVEVCHILAASSMLPKGAIVPDNGLSAMSTINRIPRATPYRVRMTKRAVMTEDGNVITAIFGSKTSASGLAL